MPNNELAILLATGFGTNLDFSPIPVVVASYNFLLTPFLTSLTIFLR